MNKNIEYKDSGIEWIGEIPKHWGTARIKTVLRNRGEKNTSGFIKQVLSLTNDRGVILYEDKGNIGNKSKNNLSGYNIARKGDIVINSMNIIIGSVGLSAYTGCISPVYYALYAINKNNIHFLSYIFQTKEYQLFLKGYGNGILPHRMRIPIDNLYMTRIPLPPKEEQKKIADFLDNKVKNINNVIDINKKLIKNYKEQKESLISEVITKGLDKNVEYKDSGIEWIGEIPKHWKMGRLKYMLCTNMDYGTPTSGVPYRSSLRRYVRITDIDNYGNLKERDKQSVPEYIDSKYNLCDNDLLFARSGSVGRTFLYKEHYGPMAFAGYLIRAQINDKVASVNYINYYTHSHVYKAWVGSAGSQTTIQNINAQQYSNMPIPLPPKEEQEEIADYLDKEVKRIDTTIEIKEKQIELFEEYRDSLIYEYVTGKKLV